MSAGQGGERGVLGDHPIGIVSSLHLLEGGIPRTVNPGGRDGGHPALSQGRAMRLPRKRFDPAEPIAVVPEAVLEGEI
jgi:hypothetical protein